MGTETYKPAKLFTVDEANRMLPLVRAIATDLQELAGDLRQRQLRIDHLIKGDDQQSGDPYADELVQMRSDLENDSARLTEYLEELRELGVEAKGALEGLVDFPAMLDGRIVYLCWKLGEPEVLHWHEIDGGFAGRQPLTAEIGASPSGEEPGFDAQS